MKHHTNGEAHRARNVLGGVLQICSTQPLTGFHRNGCCETGPDDHGVHAICCDLTAEFLAFSKQMGNDRSTPMPEFGFPGLNPGDRWCVCASRWVEAHEAGAAPKVVLEATHERMLDFVSLDVLREHGVEA